MVPENAARIRVGFGLLILVLIGQFIIATKVVQPYPALVLPSFGHVPKGTMTSTVNNFDITAYRASGQTVELQPWELMSDVIPRHARFAVARLKSPTTAGVKKKVQLAGHTLDVRLGKRDRKADYGDFSATVLHRLSDQLGTEDPVNRVVVTYYTERFDYARRQFSGRRQTDSFVIAKSTDELVK